MSVEVSSLLPDSALADDSMTDEEVGMMPGPHSMTGTTMARTQFMEHRWGNRFELGAVTKLRLADGRVEDVLVRDASISGAFIETRARFVPLGRVSLGSIARPGEWLDGWVVRIDSQGVALEWMSPELSCLAALLSPSPSET